jgi:urea transport system permease protein
MISVTESVLLNPLRKVVLLLMLVCCCSVSFGETERSARQVFSELILSDKSNQEALLEELSTYGDPDISVIYEAWRTGGIFTLVDGDTVRLLQFTDEKWTRVRTGDAVVLTAEAVESAEKTRASRSLRKQMKGLLDTLGLKSEDPSVRINSAIKMGRSLKPEFVPALEARLAVESSDEVRVAIQEALAISLLENGDEAQKLTSVEQLADLKSSASRGFIEGVLEVEIEAGNADGALAVACTTALRRIEEHMNLMEFLGSFFRGFSTGSVLLIVSFGLAITFGLMGIINMAHGEFVAIGGYTTYMVQTFFINTWGISSEAFGWYFVVSLPLSFLVAAGFGLLLEKSIIRFLYRRPLESLLCTWGISMVMQQCFRLIFGAANVQVNNPTWLMGNLSLGGFSMSYTRLFIMFIALVVVVLTWLLLRKTNLGLHIRAVMQNRGMASSLGIPVARVNSMTFALGCGLAALGGSVLSQIGNVGPLMGQQYIVDSFMVVVIGSVGNLLGAGLSAMGIGLVDQLLQPALGPVMGKITVFFVIILFLQWRPGGLFPARSRSLDD